MPARPEQDGQHRLPQHLTPTEMSHFTSRIRLCAAWLKHATARVLKSLLYAFAMFLAMNDKVGFAMRDDEEPEPES